MNKLRSWMRKYMPVQLLNRYRMYKKNTIRRKLENEAKKGQVIRTADLIQQLRNSGIQKNDAVLVHASMSKIGYLENGPETVVNALLDVVGPNGHLLMPTSPNAGLQLEYIQALDCFDVKNTPSKLGALSEYFRQLPDAVRSVNATEPVSCIGPDAAWFTEGHFNERTPYTFNSPFARLAQRKGKILYIGVTLDNAGTSLHVLEDIVPNFKFPVYYPEIFKVKVKLTDGRIVETQTKVHNPAQSAKRKCDGLIPFFKAKGVLSEVRIGKAKTLLVDADGMVQAMCEGYTHQGITMYTPNGELN